MTMHFSFQTVSDIRCASYASQQLGTVLQQKFAPAEVLIVTDSMLVKLGKLEPILASLDELGIGYRIFDGVKADPPESVILQASEQALQADVIIGVGGGSSMDTAKLVAVLATQQQALSEMYGVDNIRCKRKPLVQIPTTAGTGSEVTPIAVVTTGESTKSGVVSATLYADLVMLDAALLLGMPAHITAETGIDAMVHAIEAYTSKIKKNPLSDNLARQALLLLSQALPLAYQDGDNIKYREETLLGAMLAGQAFANAPVAGVHALAYPLGGIYHLAHGLSNALMLPHVMRFNLSAAQKEYAELACLLMTDLPANQALQAESLLEYVQTLAAQLNLNKRLRDVGVTHDDLPRLASEAMLQTRLLQNNPRPIAYADALTLYQQAW